MYRVFNSGLSQFDVEASTEKTRVQARNSVDVRVTAEVTITTAGLSTGNEVEGIYDYIDGLKPLRSGRFTGTGTAGDPIHIVKGKPNDRRIYRIFNSGENNLTVKRSLSDPDPITVKEACSMDIAIGQDLLIQGTNVEGIYDYVDPANPVRSGRFKITTNPTSGSQIMAMRHLTDERAWYRIYNSGTSTITVQFGTAGGTEDISKGQSLDVAVRKQANKCNITVISSAPFEGIYEFLGSD
jgi:hypothetical protein